MCLYLRVRFGKRTRVAFIDSTPLSVCHNQRIGRHRAFAEVARRGKSSLGWFYGFKLHLIVNDRGELLAVQLTPGNTDDRIPVPQIEHTRHRSTTNFIVNLIAGLVAYTWQAKKLSLHLSDKDMAFLPALV